MKKTNLATPALAVLCLLGAGACNNPEVKQQTQQAGEAIKAAGKETGEAVKAAGQVAVEQTKEAAEEAGAALREAGKEAGQDLAAAAERAGDQAKRKLTDAGVTASIKAKMIANPDVKGVTIEVTTVEGRVTLAGTAKTSYQKDEAEKVARQTEGVVSVDNRIVVAGR